MRPSGLLAVKTTPKPLSACAALSFCAALLLSACLDSNTEFRPPSGSGLTVTARAADTFGLGDTSRQALDARLSAQITLLPGQEALFVGTVSRDSLPVASRWNFGDGVFSPDRVASHAYASPGDYRAVFSSRDSSGLAVFDTVRVTVDGLSGAAVRGLVRFQGKRAHDGITVLFRPRGQISTPVSLLTDSLGMYAKLANFSPDAYEIIFQDTRYQYFVPETLHTVDIQEGRLRQFDPVVLRDVHDPRFGAPTPAGTVNIRRPGIGAAFSDQGSGISPSSFRLTLNGELAAGNLDVDTAGFSFMPDLRLPDGAHQVSATVKDSAGNAAAETWSFTVDAMKVTAMPDTQVSIHSQVQLRARVSDVYGRVARWRWDFDGDGKWDLVREVPDTQAVAEHTFRHESVYRAVVEALDDRGTLKQAVSIFTVTNQAPVVDSIRNDTLVSTRDTVLFFAQAHDPDGRIAEAAWDFEGDGAFEAVDTVLKTVPHVYRAGGEYRAVLRLTDDDGKATRDTVRVTVDSIPPGAPAVAVAALANTPRPKWTWASGEGGSGAYRYKLDEGDLNAGATLTGQTEFTPAADLPDGNHILYVQERDALHNWSATGSALVTVDLTPPAAPLVSAPASPTTNATPQWTWAGGGGGAGKYRRKLDDTDFSAGSDSSSATVFTPASALSDGLHTLYVQERDFAGNWSAAGSASITVDATGPNPPLITPPESPTINRQPTWTWKSGRGGGNGRFRFNLDQASWSPETTVTSYRPAAGLAHGIHVLFVQERDSLGNWSAAGTGRVVVDILGPDAPQVSAPASPTNNRTPIWTWVSGGNGGSGAFRWKLDNPSFAGGADSGRVTQFSPASALGEGPHQLYVQEQDSAGNWSASGTASLIVDITPPNAPVVAAPASPVNARPTWTWISGGGGGTGKYRIKLDDSALASGALSTNARSYMPDARLADGSHVIYVQEQDTAGNWSAAGTGQVTVDAQAPPNPPRVTVATPTIDFTPTWTWTGTAGGDGTFRYHLDNADSNLAGGAVETTSLSFTPGADLAKGTHDLYVWERNAAGAWSQRGQASVQIQSYLITTVDSGGIVGLYSSIAIPPDGMPIISYFDDFNDDLKTVKCGNEYCSSGNLIRTIDPSLGVNLGGVGRSSVRIGSDQLPIIAYDRDGELIVAKCGDASCSVANLAAVDVNIGSVGNFVSAFIPADGLPVIGYSNSGGDGLRIAKCGNGSCSSGNLITTVDNGKIFSPSLAVPSDGLPIVSYRHELSRSLKVLKCGNASCSDGGIISTLDTGQSSGYYSSIAIPADGLPIIGHYSGGGKYFIKCGNQHCSAENIAVSMQSGFYYFSVAVASDGAPIFASCVFSENLEVIKCGNETCSSGNVRTRLDGNGIYPSLVVPADGLPVISYFNKATGDLMVIKCGQPDCSP